MYYSLYRAFIAFIPGLIIAFQDSTFMVVKIRYRLVCHQLIHGDFVIPRVMGDKLKSIRLLFYLSC